MRLRIYSISCKKYSKRTPAFLRNIILTTGIKKNAMGMSLSPCGNCQRVCLAAGDGHIAKYKYDSIKSKWWGVNPAI
jgi:hypothetical protein